MAKRPAQNSRAAPKGATTRARARSSGNSQGVSGIPGWLWAIAGLIGGFALSQYLDHTSPEPVAAVVPKPASQSSSSQASSGSSESGKAGTGSAQPATPTFEFYTLLPETEVIAPNSSSNTPETTAKAARGGRRRRRQPDQAARRDRQLHAAGGVVPRYRRCRTARQPAQGFRPAGQDHDVRANGNQIWHRVQVGPYRDTRELNRAQDLMVTQGIDR
ncbi:sporulation-like protein [Salinicola tamaricis]|uniref:sporulation-like protein n=1 Tax=Salinicola tamaricis TaxID=1771309 RepID=UPI003BF5C4E2